MRIAVKNTSAFKAAMADVSSGMREAAIDAVAETALAIDAGVKLKIQRDPASGKIYQKYSPRRTHQASAAGQAPATDTGNLVGSIHTDIQGLRASVGSRLAYAAYLEYGTRTIAPRPAWEPVVEAERIKFNATIEAHLRRVF